MCPAVLPGGEKGGILCLSPGLFIPGHQTLPQTSSVDWFQWESVPFSFVLWCLTASQLPRSKIRDEAASHCAVFETASNEVNVFQRRLLCRPNNHICGLCAACRWSNVQLTWLDNFPACVLVCVWSSSTPTLHCVHPPGVSPVWRCHFNSQDWTKDSVIASQLLRSPASAPLWNSSSFSPLQACQCSSPGYPVSHSSLSSPIMLTGNIFRKISSTWTWTFMTSQPCGVRPTV